MKEEEEEWKEEEEEKERRRRIEGNITTRHPDPDTTPRPPTPP